MEFLSEYGLFLLKIMTFVIAMLVLFLGIFAISFRSKDKSKLTIKNLNKKYKNFQMTLQQKILKKDDFKKLVKEAKKADKEESVTKKNVYVIHFDGDIKAQAVDNLREEVSAILQVATAKDEVIILLESQGGGR